MAKKKGKPVRTPEIVNRKARHNYEITDTLEVGIQLLGSEVKSLRDGRASIAEGYVRAELEPKPGLYLHGTTIQEYAPAANAPHPPKRVRKLLAHKREIEKLYGQSQQKGVTIVPLKMYFKNGKAKMLVGLAAGKSKHDRRQDIAKREHERAIRRAMTRKTL